MAFEFSSSPNATGTPEISRQDSSGRRRGSSGDGDALKAIHDQIEEHRSLHENRGFLSRAVASLTGENTAIARLHDLEHKGQLEKLQKNAITEAIQSDKDSISFKIRFASTQAVFSKPLLCFFHGQWVFPGKLSWAPFMPPISYVGTTRIRPPKCSLTERQALLKEPCLNLAWTDWF